MQNFKVATTNVESLIDYSSQSKEKKINYGKDGGQKSEHRDCVFYDGNKMDKLKNGKSNTLGPKKSCFMCNCLYWMRDCNNEPT